MNSNALGLIRSKSLSVNWLIELWDYEHILFSLRFSAFSWFSRINLYYIQFSSVQSLNLVRLFATPWIAACQASLSINQLPEFTQTHVHQVSDAIQPLITWKKLWNLSYPCAYILILHSSNSHWSLNPHNTDTVYFSVSLQNRCHLLISHQMGKIPWYLRQ